MAIQNHFEQQLNKLIESLPPATQNNSRKITRENIKRIAGMKNQKTAAWLLENKYGFDCDYDDLDSGEGPRNPV